MILVGILYVYNYINVTSDEDPLIFFVNFVLR